MAPPRSEVATDATIPNFARVHLAHAVVQDVATASGVALLHLKGAALTPGLRPAWRESADVDVLVRPGDFERLERALGARGWESHSGLEMGSVFKHAANWWHRDWGYVDLHAHWPGATVDPAEAYAALAEGGALREIAHRPCPVPGPDAQLLVLLLHAARTQDSVDVEFAWTRQPEERRAAVLALADRLGARVALAAAIGGLEDYRGDPHYPLWHYYSTGGGRLDEWRARYRSATTWRERAGVLVDAGRVNRDHLRIRLGRPPTRRELRRAQLSRLATLARELRRQAFGRRTP